MRPDSRASPGDENHWSLYVRDNVIRAGQKLACLFFSTTLRDRDIASGRVDFLDATTISTDCAFNQKFLEDIPAIVLKKFNSCPGVVPVITEFFGPIERGVDRSGQAGVHGFVCLDGSHGTRCTRVADPEGD